MRRKRTNAGVTAEQRRERENLAPRLQDEVPILRELTITVDESTRDGIGATTHKRHIVVSSAPALFEIPCSDRDCLDGGFDITDTLMRAMKSEKVLVEGQVSCAGNVGDGPCSHTIRFVAHAAYGSKAA